MSESFTAVLHPTSQLIAASVGIPGPPGANGVDGSQWFTGTGAPAPALGSPGDMYLENDGDVWQSNDVSGWLVTPTNIRGPVGATGATGATGSAGAQGPAGSVSSVGSHLLFSPDATYDIGQSGASRPRNLYLAGTATVGDGSQTAPGLTFWNEPNTGIWRSGSNTLAFVTGGSWRVALTPTQMLFSADNAIDIGSAVANRPRNLYLAGTATVGAVTATGAVSLTGGLFVGGVFTPSGTGPGMELRYAAGAASILAYDRTAGQFKDLVLQGLTVTFNTQGADAWRMSGAGHFISPTDNTFDIGASGANRPRNLYLAGTATVPVISGGSGSLVLNSANSNRWVIETTGDLLSWGDGNKNIGAPGANRPLNLYLAGTATVGGQIQAANGTAAAPSITFASDPDTGIFWPNAANYLSFVTAGVMRWNIEPSGNLTTQTDNALDIGGASNRPRNLYLAGTATVGTSVVTPLLSSSASLALSSAAGTFIDFGNATTGSSWRFNSVGVFHCLAHNTYDIGTLGNYSPRTIYAGTNIYADGAVRTGTKAGAALDGDVSGAADGMLRVDTTNHRLYVRDGGTWRYAALT